VVPVLVRLALVPLVSGFPLFLNLVT
jgi:hypothetical protein